ncbi:5'-nucleotidase, lipoprotein e(P4) family [Mucilaginibacter sp. X4EP1]|uniref:5'-nucleotidase, lipoprotein e(P4) family n=1 Tax=Mucilaginibacter sp. X4EP1 TaxID=2723092 RepID=UPI0021674F8D|nr:5'-nucleotidase, lipoprotein e(P4) family [Mucilaginibacter sp. X4EP1]MCS3815024.1 5'-nucleotidase (lipoprotein e(P4) family) [Mucilaginibacter sp. X4EP1]
MKKAFLLILISGFCLCTFAQTTNLSIPNGGKTWASIYQQRAAEYKALCFQAYNIAKLRLDIALKQHHTKPYAVVTDIDETLLDNSPYDAQRAVSNLDYDPKTWKEWTAKSICDTVPGAAAFFKYAAKRGVTVFYITNRDEDERAGTLKNLQLYGLPNTDNAHLLLKQKSSSKESRRAAVLKTHQIILLCGDNLADFDALYDNHPDEDNRTATTQKLMKQFGSRYIIVPNPSYDDWEGALFNYGKLSNAQKDSVIKSKLKTASQ